MDVALTCRTLVAAAAILSATVGASPGAVAVSGAGDVTQRAGVWQIGSVPFEGILLERDAGRFVRMAVRVAGGRPDGREWRWYPNGRLESVRAYSAGRKVGVHRGWWSDGSSRFEADFRDDGFHGRYRAWYANGRLADLRTYVDGRESGRQQSWTADGALFLNYEVRNGRRYGMVNPKPCIPTGKVTS